MKIIIILCISFFCIIHDALAVRITYVHTDALGSPVAETDESGNVKWTEHYTPFGKKIDEDPESSENSVGYTGHQFDSDTGLSYMQARYYDPVIGRFYSNDPVGFRDVHSFNRYAYANNNPYKYIDPDGNEPVGINVGGSATLLGKFSFSTMILFDTKTYELAFVTNQELGVGAGKGAGLFWNAVWTDDGVTIDDFGGTGTSINGSIGKLNASIALPDSIHGVEATKDELFNGEKSGNGGIYEAGVTLGKGKEAGVTRTTSQVHKINIIGKIFNVSGRIDSKRLNKELEKSKE